MKKALSYLLILSMLICLASPCAAALEAGPIITCESVEVTCGAGRELSLGVSIENNPGIYSIEFIIYYDRYELAKGDSNAFDGTLASEEWSAVNGEMAGTHSKVKNYIPAELRSTSRAFVVDVYGEYNEDINDMEAIFGDGVLFNVPLKTVGEGIGTFNYTVVVVEAYDADGNALEIEDFNGTVTCIEDAFADMYDDFTVFMDPADTVIDKGTDKLDINIRFANNPGLWATRMYIVYPDVLTLSDGGEKPKPQITNSLEIYTSPESMICGLPDLPLTDPRQVATFQDLMKADPSIVKEGYHSTTIYFELASFDDFISEDGVLCTLSFNVSADVEEGASYDISIYYGDADFLWASTDDETGMPVFTTFEPHVYGTAVGITECLHPATKTEGKNPDCGNSGYNRVVCAECGEVFEEVIYPATGLHSVGYVDHVEPGCGTDGYTKTYCAVCGQLFDEVIYPATGLHSVGRVENVKPTCVADGYTKTFCAVCGQQMGETEILPANGEHTPGDEATCEAPQVCTVCGVTLAPEKGHVRDDNGICTVCYVFESPHSYPQNANLSWKLNIPYAKSISLVFDEKTITYYMDFIYIYDRYGRQVGRYSDTDLRNNTVTVYGSGLEVRLVSGSYYYGNIYGFKVVRVDVEYYDSFGDFAYEIGPEGNSVIITDWFGEGGTVKIPAEIEGLPVTAIGDYAFYGYEGIETVFIPETVTEIGRKAFLGCSGLSTVCYGGAYGAWSGVFVGDGNENLINAKRYTLADAETADGFVYKITEGGVTLSGYRGDLADIVIPAEIEGIPVTAVSYRAFYNENSIRSVVLPDSITAINSYAFYGCSSLRSIHMSDNIQTIGIAAFSGCVSLEVLELPDSLSSVGSQAFNGLYGITRVYFAGTLECWTALNTGVEAVCGVGTPMEGFIYTTDAENSTAKIIGYNGDSSDIFIPEEFNGYTVTEIDAETFAGADITSVYIPGSVSRIADSSFAGCTQLESVTFGEGVIEIGDYAFDGCVSLRALELTEEVTYIWMYAFRGCSALERVYLPSSLAVVEYKAFYRCDALNEIVYNGSPSYFEDVYVGNGNDALYNAGITYLVEDEPTYVFIPVPEGMRAEDCILYYVDGYGVATEVFVECIDGYFVATLQRVGYYIVRNAASDIPAEPETPVIGSGDVDGDGQVTGLDSNRLQRIISGFATVSEGTDAFAAADVNGDGKINGADMNILKRMISGVI